MGSSLTAEIIGNIEFQFPPSNNEWKILLDDSILEKIPSFEDIDEEDFQLRSDYQWGEPLSNEDVEDVLVSQPSRFKTFTHREGDALEFFVAYQDNNPEWDEEDDKIDSIESAQKNLDEWINAYMPNHKFVLNSLLDSDDESFGEWELNDGTQDIMHGYTRILKARVNGEVKSVTLLGYLSTALLTEHNRSLWTNMLNEAKISH
jgi:hypothetical protein